MLWALCLVDLVDLYRIHKSVVGIVVQQCDIKLVHFLWRFTKCRDTAIVSAREQSPSLCLNKGLCSAVMLALTTSEDVYTFSNLKGFSKKKGKNEITNHIIREKYSTTGYKWWIILSWVLLFRNTINRMISIWCVINVQSSHVHIRSVGAKRIYGFKEVWDTNERIVAGL